MGVLPPVPPRIGWSDRVRLGRDYYVRVAGNDYSVDPTVIGRFVDVRCGLTLVTVACAGVPVAAHARCWDQRQTISDPAHVATAHTLRTLYRTRRSTGPTTVGEQAGVRPLSVYDDMFDLTSPRTDTQLEAVAG